LLFYKRETLHRTLLHRVNALFIIKTPCRFTATSGFCFFIRAKPYIAPSYVGFSDLFVSKTLCRLNATSGFVAFLRENPYVERFYVGFYCFFKKETLHRTPLHREKRSRGQPITNHLKGVNHIWSYRNQMKMLQKMEMEKSRGKRRNSEKTP